MANTINWGKIYESTAWGNTDNSISWGKSYADLAGGGPKNTSLPVISGTAERGQTLTSTTGTWTGTGTITYAYQWKRNGVDISGATASTYVLVAADDNASMTCVVSATDSEGTKSATSNVLGPVLGSPFLLSSPVASGTAQVGQTLSTTDGTWQGVATITFAYQWRRDAVNIAGATSSTYTLVAADYATDVDCVVTATNGLGSANADSNDLGPIAGTAPVISGVPTISTQTQVGETITATAASVTGVPTPTTSWQWQRSADGSTGWANISGATSSTYTLVAADDTNYVRAVQTETNAVGTDSANSAASAQISSVPAFTGLLDTYSGAAAAYSLRQLSSTYSGDAIVVTTNGSDSASIGFVNNELDTASLEAFAGSGDAYVSVWYDQSGNGKNATQTSFSAMPKIVSSGNVITLNSKPSIEAASILKGFDCGSFSWTAGYISSVINRTGRIGSFDSLWIFDGTPYNQFYSSGSNWSYFSGSTAYNTTIPLSTSQKLITMNDDGADTKFYDNSSLDSTFSISNNITSQSLSLMYSGTRAWLGNMQEFIFWDSDQSTTRTGIETNINSYYSIY